VTVDMRAIVPTFAARVKPLGMVAERTAGAYIWAMDEEELETFARALLGPARVVDLKDRLLSQGWRCSSCGLLVESAKPIPVPAPCPRCRGIAFETADPSVH
jgi:predicted Zn-ribbon and HTH transcriptional regulator